MNKRRYSNRRRKNILRVFILLMAIIITVVMWRTIKIDVQVGELTLPKILQSEKSFADTSGEWNLILVDRNHYIPDNYQVELTELANGKKVDSRIYPELQQMFNDARAEGLALFVREGYRTTEEQQKIMDEKINEYEKQGYSAKEAKKRAEKYVAIPDTSEHQLGLSVDINADTDKYSENLIKSSTIGTQKTPHLDNYTLCYIEMMCGCQLQNDEHTLPVIIHLPATY